MMAQAAWGRVRRIPLYLVCLLALPGAGAGEAFVTVMDWQAGHFLVATRVGIDGVDAASFPVSLDACRRALLLDLLYTPEDASASAPGVGSASVLFELGAEARDANGSLLGARRILSPAYGIPLGTMPAGGDYEVRLVLVTGADVSWEARLRAREVFGDMACLPRLLVNEVEANPAGPDAGGEWVELINPGDEPVDATGWALRHGATSQPLPDGLVVPAGGRVVLALDAPLPDAGVLLSLDAPFGYVSDETPPLDDAADDARTWQRVPDGAAAWAFAHGTPDAANAA